MSFGEQTAVRILCLLTELVQFGLNPLCLGFSLS